MRYALCLLLSVLSTKLSARENEQRFLSGRQRQIIEAARRPWRVAQERGGMIDAYQGEGGRFHPEIRVRAPCALPHRIREPDRPSDII